MTEPGIPNLDALTPEDLRDAIDALRALADYASYRLTSIQLRESGLIAKAQRIEAMQQAIYDTLPEWAKW